MRAMIFSLMATLLIACSGNQGGKPFRDVGPEQSTFLVTPAEPLEIPQTFALSQPTPGGVNRAEQ